LLTDPQDPLRRTFAPPIVTRSLLIAAVVGTLLNAINQGPELWHGNPLVLWKLVLTYCVPFLVASYGAFSALRSG
jgi:hypothetical protein